MPDAKAYKNKKGVGLLSPLLFSFTLIFFGGGMLVNESGYTAMSCNNYVIQQMGKDGFEKAYYIFIHAGDKTERLSFGKAFNEAHHAGDTISLCIVTGNLGFAYYKIHN